MSTSVISSCSLKPEEHLVLVAGSLNVDFSVRVPHLPLLGETVLGSGYDLSPGGKGANQAVACARAGATVRMLGAVGRDAHGDLLKTSLRQNGVDLNWLQTVEASTGVAFVSVTGDGENAIIVSEGANATLRPEHLPSLRGVSHLIMPLEIPLDTVRAFAQAAHAAGVSVVLNASPAQPLDDHLLECIDLLIVNAGELSVLNEAGPAVGGSSEETVAQARHLQSRGPKTVIVTLGGSGCLAVTPSGEELRLPAFEVEVRDTTGAGDTFTGVLVAHLARRKTLREALRVAGAAAALACTRAGAQTSMPDDAEVQRFLQGVLPECRANK